MIEEWQVRTPATKKGGTTPFCNGGKVVLTVAPSGLSYPWKKGNNNIAEATLQSYTADSKTTILNCGECNDFGRTIFHSILSPQNPLSIAFISQASYSGHAVSITCYSSPGSG